MRASVLSSRCALGRSIQPLRNQGSMTTLTFRLTRHSKPRNKIGLPVLQVFGNHR